jgi:hypothetical protein
MAFSPIEEKIKRIPSILPSDMSNDDEIVMINT